MPDPVIRYDQVEDEVIERLSSITSINNQIQVAPAPDEEIDYERAFHRPHVWVLVEQEQAGERFDSELMIQNTTLSVVVTIQFKKLRGLGGVRHIEQVVRQLMIGFRPTDFQKLQFVGSQHEKTDNIWSMFLAFQAEGVVQETPAAEAVVTLQQITYETEYDPTFLVVPDPDNPDEL